MFVLHKWLGQFCPSIARARLSKHSTDTTVRATVSGLDAFVDAANNEVGSLPYSVRSGIISSTVKTCTNRQMEPPIWARQDSARRRYVREMFSRVAPRYDLLNSLLSFQLHHYWRRRVVRMLRLAPDARVLDLCTGTGDLAIALARHLGPAGEVVALDFCEPMLRIGRAKAQRRGLNHTIWLQADALQLPFTDAQFDAATMAFGLRNLIDKPAALHEIYRVLKSGGKLAILELTRPQRAPVTWLYDLYALHILPRVGKRLSQADAYLYLPMSIRHYEDRATIAEYMKEAGFANVYYRDLTFGVVCVHMGVKQ
ncbi:MAG: bifunctional demethylmenaquinone methyltransferase/2-methoxy-6-polyprenyl-1,4-benzoquinol methylase UbiE [Fimbriimonadales bacterium]|nr:bifunctional demethylmenaquinone methyltransferase/2-methoxy-6-polyprenyl-1,4-benzoquinol methylase UbiE [Fimbriimonadales bacterium]